MTKTSDKRMIDELDRVIQQEIAWCLDHPDKELTEEHQTGFMNGLRQAQYLLRAVKKSIEEMGE
jgi:hypothetical protein